MLRSFALLRRKLRALPDMVGVDFCRSFFRFSEDGCNLIVEARHYRLECRLNAVYFSVASLNKVRFDLLYGTACR